VVTKLRPSVGRMQSESMEQPRALLITGTVGSGKTSIAAAAGSILEEARIPNAVIDLDALSHSWPTPPDDPFNFAMELRNLACIARNYLAAGIHRLVLAGVAETTSERARYRDADGVELSVCRLRATLTELHRRLRIRHAGADTEMQWHLNRAGQLDQILDRTEVADFEIRSDGRTLTDVAAAVLNRAGWI
jgi:adenylylsulfate kinase